MPAKFFLNFCFFEGRMDQQDVAIVLLRAEVLNELSVEHFAKLLSYVAVAGSTF